MMHSQKLDCAGDIITIAERVKKILYEKQIKEQKNLINDNKFPTILEKEAENFLMHHSLAKPEDEDDVDSEGGSLREVEEEDDLSLDNIQQYKEKFEEEDG